MTRAEQINHHWRSEEEALCLAHKYLTTRNYAEAAQSALSASHHRFARAALEGRYAPRGN